MSIAQNGTAFDLTGDRNNPAIVLIHGLGLQRAMWRDFVPRLQHRYCILSYDLLGHGESCRAAEKPSLDSFAMQLKELLDELNIQQCALVGFSLGGMINRRFAMDYPERVTSLIIMNSPHQREAHEQQRVEARAAKSAAGGPAATLDSTLRRWFTTPYLDSHDAAVDRVRNWVLQNDPVNYAHCRMVLAAGVTELVDPTPPIEQPSLVITCEHDRGSTPKMSAEIAAEITGAKFHIVPRLQHLGLLEEPEIFIDLIENFLETNL